MEKKSNGKTAVIITGILFALSLAALVILLALQLGGGGTEETAPQENAGEQEPGNAEDQETPEDKTPQEGEAEEPREARKFRTAARR